MATKLSRNVTIVNQLGLHARAATKLAQLCQQFQAHIELVYQDKTADACSVLALLMLASSKGKTLQVTAEGTDAEAALSAVVSLIEQGFGE
ncbi:MULTISPECIES: HPr family phosphocarrier protein [unclassified Arsukibacterium]|uniref:HPr family phosphocarrier protein n=1 Tax=unclassified Arsukibacterium TaxID=2635278 RepID=UPI000C5766BC|nr:MULTISPECIES: HPr family phosphocarrier protein [unclassified Arsukibacterium]MAA94160.1 HPr family phosphocarrier protein [Rheinheimera sp.]MBM34162.1 HPr family phosphocarrier protein [Rheinheimera sp.]HAW92461.1 HPr family phosphocarrier protein [Candidatus Azambacteria bacterium]|tara:strand:- start:1379 stop:1651 length:273 start_codon:yes stop_codon:yes gene_type:complete